MPSRTWDWVVTGLVLIAGIYLLFVPPIVGQADQGDYARLIDRVGLTPLPGLTADELYKCWVRADWTVVPPRPLYGFSTAEFPARLAILLSLNLSKGATFDIRWAAGVQLAVLLAVLLSILRSARTLPVQAYIVIALGVVLVATNSRNISYFNSFYGESAAFLGIFALVAASLKAVTTDQLSRRHLLAIALAGAFFAGSKAQNAPLGALIACWLVWLFWGTPECRAAIATALALICLGVLVLKRAPAPESNLFNAIYDRVLPNSPDPAGALAELGANPETVGWMNKSFWEVKIESPDLYPRKATVARLLAFYLQHPSIDLSMARDALTLNNDVFYMGNFTKDSGATCGTRTRAFTGYDRMRAYLAGIWFVFPLLIANMAAVLFWRNRTGSLISLLGVMTLVAFGIGAYYDNEPRKHLFTFNLLFDVTLFADVTAFLVLLTQKRVAWSVLLQGVFRTLTKQAAFALLGILAVAQAGSTVGVDIALGKMTSQSSSLYSYGASQGKEAVDGNTDGNFFNGSVTHTNPEINAWWQVDLGTPASINSVVIWNRTDCCRDRLNDYWIFLSDVPFNPGDTPNTLQKRAGTWSRHQTSVVTSSVNIATAESRGRYIRIQLAGANALSLAEVQVFGRLR